MGVYRMWRDAGYRVGAFVIGLTMEFASLEAAFYQTAALMHLSGLVVQLWMKETHPELGTHKPPLVAGNAPDPILPED